MRFSPPTTTRLTTTKAYDNLDRLASVTNTPSMGSVQSVVYSYNAANQRTRLTREDASHWDFAYDALGQVNAGAKKLSTGEVIQGNDYAYAFDDIGNRKTATANGRTSLFDASLVNQYLRRTIPGAVDVFGTANAAATVTVTFPAASTTVLPAARQGGWFYRQLTVDNGTSAQYPELKVTGVKNLVGPNGEDAVAEETRYAFLPQTPETFTHDADGNLTTDGRWTYTWDAENRLVQMETRTDLGAQAAGLPRQKLEFAYDAQGRRIQKKVSNWSTGTSTYQLSSDTRFVFDGWNLVAELDGLNANAVVRNYVWGLDLSGSAQGAGGVGGLLAMSLSNGSTYLPAYDGNGNVIGLVNAGDGSLSADLEYDPFGNVVKAVGPAANIQPFGFSTKYTDSETSLVYYGLRYYAPSTGRWLSRDPIEEQGGSNLYGFVANDPVDRVDAYGLWGTPDHERMTRAAWANASLPHGMLPFQNLMADVLVRENHRVDSEWSSRLFWHFNRHPDQDIDAAVSEYTNNITVQRRRIHDALAKPDKASCRMAVEIMGNLSHAFEDYYAHAILRRDPSADPRRTSATATTTISTDTSLTSRFDGSVGYVTGNPNTPGANMKPASWTWFGFGEHGMSEPGDRAPDRATRMAQAQQFTAGEFRPFAADWWKACECYATEACSH